MQADSTFQSLNYMRKSQIALSRGTKKFGAAYYQAARDDLWDLSKEDFRLAMVENLEEWLAQTDNTSMSPICREDNNQSQSIQQSPFQPVPSSNIVPFGMATDLRNWQLQSPPQKKTRELLESCSNTSKRLKDKMAEIGQIINRSQAKKSHNRSDNADRNESSSYNALQHYTPNNIARQDLNAPDNNLLDSSSSYRQNLDLKQPIARQSLKVNEINRLSSSIPYQQNTYQNVTYHIERPNNNMIRHSQRESDSTLYNQERLSQNNPLRHHAFNQHEVFEPSRK